MTKENIRKQLRLRRQQMRAETERNEDSNVEIKEPCVVKPIKTTKKKLRKKNTRSSKTPPNVVRQTEKVRNVSSNNDSTSPKKATSGNRESSIELITIPTAMNSDTYRRKNEHSKANSRLFKENEVLKQTNMQLMGEMQENIDQKYQKHIEMYAKTCEELNIKYNESKEEAIQFKTQISELRTELHRANTEVETCTSRYEKLVLQYRNETQALHDALDSSKVQHGESTNAINLQMKQIKRLEQDFEELLKDKNALENNSTTQLKAQQVAYHERITEMKKLLEAQEQKLELQSSQLQHTNTELQRQNAAAAEVKHGLEESIKLHIRSKNTLQMENKDLYEHVHSLQKELECSQHRLKELERKSTTTCRELETTIRNQRCSISQLEMELAGQKSSRDRSEAQSLSHRANIENLKSQIEVLETELARIRLSRAQDQDEIDSKTSALTHANVTIAQLQKNIMNLERTSERSLAEARESEERLNRYRKEHMLTLRDSSCLSLPLQWPIIDNKE